MKRAKELTMEDRARAVDALPAINKLHQSQVPSKTKTDSFQRGNQKTLQL